jgi:hypothetical protein
MRSGESAHKSEASGSNRTALSVAWFRTRHLWVTQASAAFCPARRPCPASAIVYSGFSPCSMASSRCTPRPRCRRHDVAPSRVIAISRRGFDAGRHGLSIVEDLIVQAHTNAGQVLVAVENAGFLRDELKHLVDGMPSKSRRNSTTPR